MSDLTLLKPLLYKLRLGGIGEILEDTLQKAVKEKWSYSQVLLDIFTREVERRNHKQSCYRLSRSGLEPTKTIELFDFNFNTNISKTIIKELAVCNYIKQGENIFFVGPSGVGKTHLANALGHEACRRGYDVLYKRTSELLDWLYSGNGDGTFEKKMFLIKKVKLLILDDFGLIPINEEYQKYLFEIISERHEKKSIIITSNRDFNEWIDIFDNALIGSAAMDRLVHKSIKLSIDGDSYRAWEFKKNQEKIIKN